MKKIGKQTYGYTVAGNLKDAGCGAKMTELFLKLEAEGRTQEQLEMLDRHRQKLLDKIHADEKKIDRLDYLAYRLRTEKREKEADGRNSHGKDKRSDI